MGKTLKVLMVTAFTLLTLIMIGVGVFLKWPEILLNEGNLKRASRFAAHFDIGVRWETATINVESPGLLNKRFFFSFDDLCVFWADDKMRACFPQLTLGAQVAWYEGLRVLELGPIVINGATVFYRLPAEKPETRSEEKKNPLAFSLPKLKFPKILKTTDFKKIQMDFKEIKLIRGDQSYQVELSAKGISEPEGRLEKIDLGLTSIQVPGITGGEVDLNLKSPAHFQYDDWSLGIKVDLTRQGGQRIQAKGQVNPQADDSINFALKGQTVLEGIASHLEVSGTLSQGELHANLQGTLAGGLEPIQRVQLNGCRLDLTPLPPKKTTAQLSFQCPGAVLIKKIDMPETAVKEHIHIPTKLSFQINLNATAPLTDISEGGLSGLLKINFDAIAQKLLSAKGDVKVDFAGNPNLPLNQWKLKTLLNFGFKLNDLATLISILKGTPYAVWAPLHVLNGTAEFRLKGKLNVKQKRGDIPVEFSTRFYSPSQKIYTDGKGKLKFDFSGEDGGLDLKLALLLDQLQLVLPTFHLGPLPNFIPDSRFKKPGEEKPSEKKEMPFKYQVAIKTEQDAVLLSNISKNGRIPFALDLKLTQEKTGGTLTLKNTPVEFFKRVATIERFDLELAKPPDKSRLDGLIKVDYAAYDITIKVIGSAGRPRFIFTSQPPLDQEQIISVLIYGRTFEDLNQSEASTVNSVSSAAAEKALSLGSMYLLASTPIESVAYNPATNQFSARFRVAKGTSIDVGTQEGKTQNLGLRQKLGGNWFINTYVENDTETGEQSGGATLEWSKRY